MAANRLKKDQDALRSRAKRRPRTMASTKATLEAKKKNDYRKAQLEKKREKERLEKLALEYVRRGYERVERQSLGGVVRSLVGGDGVGDGDDTNTMTNINDSSNNNKGRLMLEATSIHGQGDKITLPSSLLSTLASRDLLRTSQEKGQPLFFRLGIRRQRPGHDCHYAFPASDKMKQLMGDYNDSNKSTHDRDGTNHDKTKDDAGSGMDLDDNQENENSMMVDDDDEDENDEKWEQAYEDELSHEYISYVYATVIEFTQDEGYIGLPLCIATALLSPKNTNTNSEEGGSDSALSPMTIESKLTVDPAFASNANENGISKTTPKLDQTNMDIDHDHNTSNKGNDDHNNDHDDTFESKTPGHPAYGQFPLPIPPIEVSLLTHLPLGKKCTLQPTQSAIQRGFYNLKDVKLALEQSLIRTRGCLNVGDVVYCWHRGVKFDLKVKDVSPSRVGAVSCVNTDIEVDIAAAADDNGDSVDGGADGVQKEKSSESGVDGQKLGNAPSGGYRLSDNRTSTTKNENENEAVVNSNDARKDKHLSGIYSELQKRDIPPEPGIEQKVNVVAVQVRGDGGKQCRRRFDSTISRMEDIFAFVLSEQIIESSSVNEFRLVTRFPRRVFTLQEHGTTILEKMDLSRQELFLIEKVV